MRVKVLGAAAGGGFPQWNCRCSNCRRLRQGSFQGSSRTQAQLAFSDGDGSWNLVNASPDLRAQIEATPDLQPQQGQRHSPIRSVILTCAELDQVLGLLLLRESQALQVYSTSAVRRILLEDNSMFGMLQRYPGQVSWSDISPGEPIAMHPDTRCTPIAVPGGYPFYVKGSRLAQSPPGEAVLALLLESSGGRKLAYFPGAPHIEDAWLPLMEQSDVVLFDGTFWTDDELIEVQGSGRTARQMGHLPVSGAGGTLERLSCLRHPRKLFIHVNNTNPMLDEQSAAYRQVKDAGWDVARDGMEFNVVTDEVVSF